MFGPMKRVLLISLIVTSTAFPASAQEDTGKSLMERGAELFFEGLRKEMEPTLDDLRDLAEQFGPAMLSFFEEMGPALAEMTKEIQDWSVYEAPEILPNGDIIIRRKPQDDTPQTPEEKPEPDEGVTDI